MMLSIAAVLVAATGWIVLGSDLSPSMAGFILAFALDLSLQIFWLLDRLINLEEQMVAVERINESKNMTSPPYALWPRPVQDILAETRLSI
jgi:ABC-type multidrug transport system fused ATPase/permease subunit